MASDPESTSSGQDAPHGSLAHALILVGPLFDAEFYARVYRDVAGDPEALLLHFCERGWQEGRNPHAGFDTVAYLQTYPDVANVGWNPFYHYVLAGHAEDRVVAPALVPSAACVAVLGYDPGDWVAILRPEVDEAFYAAQLETVPDGGFDLVAHFAYRGWLEGLSPNAGFDVHAALAERPELREARLNPLVAAIVARPPALAAAPLTDPDDPGILTTRFRRDQLFAIPDQLQALEAEFDGQRVEAGSRYDDPILRVVADNLDRGHYLAMYPDVRTAGLDPVEHYCSIGWSERRNPAVWFDTAYYLRVNTDIADSNVNPFWHYLVEGRKEGRKPHRPGGFRRDIIERAVDPDTRTKAYDRGEPTGAADPDTGEPGAAIHAAISQRPGDLAQP